MISRSPEELSRELQVLQGKVRTIAQAQRRIEREAEQLAEAIGELSCLQLEQDARLKA
jgi:prefoldin subunit 5